MANDDRLLSPERVARILDLSSDAVVRRLRSGILRGVKLHHGECNDNACHCPWRIRETAVTAYLQRMESYS